MKKLFVLVTAAIVLLFAVDTAAIGFGCKTDILNTKDKKEIVVKQEPTYYKAPPAVKEKRSKTKRKK